MANEASSVLHQIWEETTKLSDSALEAARLKMEPLGPNRGMISFTETRTNLIAAKDMIAQAVRDNKLNHLPISVQRGLLSLLSAITAHVTAMSNGTDELILFVDKVEQLNVFIWNNGFYNLSSEVLGYQEKMNRLKSMESQLEQLLTKLQESETLQQAARDSANNINLLQSSSSNKLQEMEAANKRLEDSVSAANLGQQTVSASVASVRQQNEDAARLLAAITVVDGQTKTSATQITNLVQAATSKVEELTTTINAGQQNNRSIKSEADALVTKLGKDLADAQQKQTDAITSLQTELITKANALEKTSVKAISDFGTNSKTALDQATEMASEELKKISADWDTEAKTLLAEHTQRADLLHETESKKLVDLTDELKKLELRIKDQIEKAIGFSLFSAFQRRQRFVVSSKNFWRYALFICVAAGILCGMYFVYELGNVKGFSYMYLAKLSISLPIIYAVSFSSIQYGKERRLEEEYAFKSSISVSLNPYQQLVGRLVDLKVPEERAKYTDFIIRSIDTVFESPTDRVFGGDSKHDDSGNIERVAKEIAPILDPIIKIVGKK